MYRFLLPSANREIILICPRSVWCQKLQFLHQILKILDLNSLNITKSWDHKSSASQFTNHHRPMIETDVKSQMPTSIESSASDRVLESLCESHTRAWLANGHCRIVLCFDSWSSLTELIFNSLETFLNNCACS